MSTGKADGGLTTRQAATLLDVSIKSIQNWVSAGRIRAERITPPMGQAYLVLNKQDVEQVRRERGPRDRG
jgi:excisionase family DNA binding protein